MRPSSWSISVSMVSIRGSWESKRTRNNLGQVHPAQPRPAIAAEHIQAGNEQRVLANTACAPAFIPEHSWRNLCR